MSEARSAGRAPLAWIPSLYLAEGLPNVLVSKVAGTMYKSLGISNADIGVYTSLLYLPWVIKPLWFRVVELLGTRRRWIWATQLVMGVLLAAVALALPLQHFFVSTLALLWLLTFTSATHDIAADGFYMLGTDEREQAMYVGVRSLFYRVAMIVGQGPFVILAASLGAGLGGVGHGWAMSFGVAATAFLGFGLWHRFALPHPASDRMGEASQVPQFLQEFLATFGSFFRKPKIAIVTLFLLSYRFGEAQLLPMVSPFLLDPRSSGGLGLSLKQVGVVYGVFGIAALVVGGILGGLVASRHGLKAWLWPMLFAIHLPDVVFIYLAYAQPANIAIVQACVVIEQFGYGFGFTAYLLYMMHISRGEHQTAHYAICTGFMALGMMLPGMWSGALQDLIGYRHFFVWVILATVPSFLVTLWIPLEAGYGKKAAG